MIDGWKIIQVREWVLNQVQWVLFVLRLRQELINLRFRILYVHPFCGRFGICHDVVIFVRLSVMASL